MLCHICDLKEGVGGRYGRSHFINKHERKLRRAKSRPFLPDPCLPTCNCGPKSHWLSVQLVQPALAEQGTLGPETLWRTQGNDEFHHLANISNRQTATSGNWTKTFLRCAGSYGRLSP